MISAVIGMGFGDEGKGLTVDHLATGDELVVRYSGGQQAGHTVTVNGIAHSFAHFGSGTFRGCPTYWSEFCTLDPVGLLRERKALIDLGFKPNTIFINMNCPLTTPYEKKKATWRDNMANGTCGVGVGQTWEREENFSSILALDLLYPTALSFKLDAWRKRSPPGTIPADADLHDFLKACVEVTVIPEIVFVDNFNDVKLDNGVIFEGSQGLLLDQHFGFFPHVTRSSVGIKNVRELLMGHHQLFVQGERTLERYYVTRAYQTRHGNGPMSNEDLPLKLINNENETNVKNPMQGEFRTSVLDLDLLEYGLRRDGHDVEYIDERHNLVITCLDQMTEFAFTERGKLVKCKDKYEFAEKVAFKLGFDVALLNGSAEADIEKIKY